MMFEKYILAKIIVYMPICKWICIWYIYDVWEIYLGYNYMQVNMYIVYASEYVYSICMVFGKYILAKITCNYHVAFGIWILTIFGKI